MLKNLSGSNYYERSARDANLVGSRGGERDRVARIVGVSEGEDTEGGVVGEEEESERERPVPGRLEETDGVMVDREEIRRYRGHPRHNGFPLKSHHHIITNTRKRLKFHI